MSAASEMDSVELRVVRVVNEVLGTDGGSSTVDLSMNGKLALDSLDQLSLVMALEDEFGGRLREEDAQRMTTLRELIEHVRERMGPASKA